MPIDCHPCPAFVSITPSSPVICTSSHRVSALSSPFFSPIRVHASRPTRLSTLKPPPPPTTPIACHEPSASSSSSHPPTFSLLSTAVSVVQQLTNLFPLWVVLAAVVALVHPQALAWYKLSFTTPTLVIIMLGMGLTISPSSFLAITRAPRAVIIGAAAQYTLMPILATIVTRVLSLPPALAAGVILVGVCPGGAASNVVCLLAGADVALSVVLTLVSTLLSVLLIPTLMQLLAGTIVPVNVFGLLMSTLQVVLAPLMIGAILNRSFPRAVKAASAVLPLVSVLAIVTICGAVVAANASALLSVGPRIIAAVAAMHALGGITGYLVGSLSGLPSNACRTISVEVMMQNSTLAVSLANLHFANPLTAVPGAISATLHSVFGSILAGFWRWRDRHARSKHD